MLINKTLFPLGEFFYKGIKMLIFYLTQFLNVNIIRTFCVVITPRCNAKCKMCDIWTIDDTIPDLSLEKLEEILKSDSLKHVKTLSITGGEPFLRKDIYQIYMIIRNYFPKVKVIISTNGLLQKEVITFFEKIEDAYRIQLIISIDGLRKHDFIRGVNGAFSQTLGTLRLIKEKFPQVNVMIKFTISPWNYDEILDVCEISKKENVQFLIKCIDNIKDYTASINCKKNKKRFAFDKNKRVVVVSDLKKIQADQLSNNQFRHYMFTKELINYFLKEKYNLSFCTVHSYSGFIAQKGMVYGCRNFKSLGNIYENSLDVILKKKKVYNKCKDCVSHYGFYNSLI